MRDFPLLLFFIVFFVIAIIFAPLRIKIKAHFNLIENIGFYCINLAFLTMLCGKLYIAGDGKLEIINNNNKLKGKSPSNIFMLIMLKRLNINCFELYYLGGKKNDMFVTSLLNGCVVVFFNIIFAILHNKFADIKTILSVQQSIVQDKFAFTTNIIISFSLLDIIFATILSIFYKLKRS